MILQIFIKFYEEHSQYVVELETKLLELLHKKKRCTFRSSTSLLQVQIMFHRRKLMSGCPQKETNREASKMQKQTRYDEVSTFQLLYFRTFQHYYFITFQHHYFQTSIFQHNFVYYKSEEISVNYHSIQSLQRKRICLKNCSFQPRH